MNVDRPDLQLRPHFRLYNLFRNGKLERYSKGDIVCADATKDCSSLHYLIRGYVKAYAVGDKGDEYVHGVYTRDELFPLLAMIESGHANMFYEALSGVSVYSMPIKGMLLEVYKDLELSNAMIEQLLVQFGFQSSRLENLEFKMANERLAYHLFVMSLRFGEKHEKGIVLNSVFTHKLIADMINLSRESVSREFDKLRSQGMVTNEGRSIIITDLMKLAEQINQPISDVTSKIV